MLFNLDNFDLYSPENINILNQEINEQYSFYNNSNFFTLNFNILNQNDFKDNNQFNNNYLKPSLINRNINNPNDFSFNNNQLSNVKDNNNNRENKSNKIFFISHKKGKVSNLNLKSKPIIKKKIDLSKEKPFSNNNKKYLKLKNSNINKNNFLIKNINNDISKEWNKNNGTHNKFTDDNLRRKCKHIVLNSIIDIINKKIFSIYEGNIGNNIFKKEILTLNKYQISNANIEFDRIFIHKKLSEILSEKISTRYTNYIPEHNKILIENLRNESDDMKRTFFNKLFDLTFFDCMLHFIGIKKFEELEGMKCFEDIKIELDENEEYVNTILFYLKNYEYIINNKKARKSKKSKNINDKIENILDK